MVKRFPVFMILIILLADCNQPNNDTVTVDKKNDWSSREKNLIDSISLFPDSLILKEKLIQYYRDSFNYEKAIAVVDNALKKDSSNDRLWDIKATLHFENEDTLGAVHAYEKALEFNPQPRYLSLLGSLYAQSRNSKALQLANTLRNTTDARLQEDALFITGLYYNFTGEKPKAINYFDSCISRDYTFMLAYREKGIALYDMGKYEDAILVLDKAVTLQNSFDEGYYWLGRCLEKLNRKEEAINEYKAALMYSPDYVEAKDALDRLSGK